MKRHAKQFLALFFALALTVAGVPTSDLNTVQAAESVSTKRVSDDRYLPQVAKDHIAEIVTADSNYGAFGNAIADLCSEYDEENRAYDADDKYVLCRLIAQTNGENIDWNMLGAEQVIAGPEHYYIIQFPDEDTTKLVEKWLLSNPNVVSVEPDIVISLDNEGITFTDEDVITELAEEQVEDNANSLSWGISHIGAKEYADSLLNVTNPGTIVAVVDTGVEFTHPFLAGRLMNGYDFIDNDADPTDGHSHGTHVSGTIVDCTEGLAGKITIMPVRVLNNGGSGSSSQVASGIRYAADNGAKVINLSLGGGHSSYKDDAIAYARSKGVVCVVAAGNDGKDVDAYNYCPAHSEGAITVIALDSNETIASYSNYGASCDVSAPGSNIYSSVLNGRYGTKSGTSMATPHVAALAGMIRYKYPNLDNVSVEKIICDNTRDLGTTGKDNYYGYGIVDVTNLVDKNPTISNFIVTFDANGGDGAPVAIAKYPGTSVVIPSTVPYREGYDFKGWSVTPNGAVTYLPGDIYNSDANITLYAVWGALEILNSFPREYKVQIARTGTYNLYSFVPTVSGTYTFESTGNEDTYIAIYGASMNQLAYNDDGGSSYNFKLSYNFNAGQQYYVMAKLYDATEIGVFTMVVTTSGSLAITSQPSDVTIESGRYAKFNVSSNYSDVYYQWLVSKDNGANWDRCAEASATSRQLIVEATNEKNGYKYACVVLWKSDNNINVTSAIVTLNLTQIGTFPTFGWYQNVYWYENGLRQGTYDDPQGVLGDGVVRGREIYDQGTNAWYWLDSCYDGKKACSKEVWVPYVFSAEAGWTYQQMAEVASMCGDMTQQVLDGMVSRRGKWIRYDDQGRLIIGWYTTPEGKTYYYDPITGLMAKGYVTLGGVTYHFDEITGILVG